MKHEIPVLLVGAGPVGLLAALRLRRQEVEFELIETQRQLAGRSYALGLHPETLDLLESMGLEGLAEEAHPVNRIALYEGKGRRETIELSPGAPGPRPLRVLPQADLERALRDRLEEMTCPIRWAHRLAALEVDGSGCRSTVETIETAASGFTPGTVVTMVAETRAVESSFVVGADGHGSTVRRALDLELERFGSPRGFAMFEILADVPDEDTVHLVLSSDSVSVLWPLGSGRWRCTFEISPGRELLEERFKSRARWEPAGVLPRYPKERLRNFLTERSPWFEPSKVEEILWSTVVNFEECLVEAYGRGGAWLAGDAAHLWCPLGVQSMNLGLQEAADLGDRIAVALEADSREPLVEYDRRWRNRWRRIAAAARASDRCPSWLENRAHRLPKMLPFSGSDLDSFLEEIGLALSGLD